MSKPVIYPALSPSGAAPIVLLHGWGFDQAAMAPLVEPLRQVADVWCLDLPGFGAQPALAGEGLDAQVTFLADQLPEYASLVGWSLGGVLALAYASRYRSRVGGLATLACNTKFVADKDWPEAMPAKINRMFNAGFAADPAATLKRFGALVAQGSPDERARTRSLRGMQTVPQGDEQAYAWRQGLAMLGASDLRTELAELCVPNLHLLADGDALVPASAAPSIRALNPQAQVAVVTGAGHALHWDQTAAVADLLVPFLRAVPASHLDKRWVAESFSRAAASYDSAARLQRQVGQNLLAQLTPAPGVWVDLGSGTGQFIEPLKGAAQAGATGQVIALDIAEGMLRHSRAQQRPADAWLCADAEALPLATASVDGYFSSLAIQWCEQQGRLFAELLRTLKPGGRLCLATLTEGTLAELASAWQAVDGYVHVNRFESLDNIQRALEWAGFAGIKIREETLVLHCANLRELSRELKSLGAHNVNTGRPKGLTGRKRLAALEAAYEAQRNPQGLPVTYQVCYLQAEKPL